jgi:hypothetical protein
VRGTHLLELKRRTKDVAVVGVLCSGEGDGGVVKGEQAARGGGGGRRRRRRKEEKGGQGTRGRRKERGKEAKNTNSPSSCAAMRALYRASARCRTATAGGRPRQRAARAAAIASS